MHKTIPPDYKAVTESVGWTTVDSGAVHEWWLKLQGLPATADNLRAAAVELRGVVFPTPEGAYRLPPVELFMIRWYVVKQADNLPPEARRQLTTILAHVHELFAHFHG